MRPWWDSAALNLWVERFCIGFCVAILFAIACGGVVFVALIAQGYLQARAKHKDTLRRIEVWRRERLRAPIIKAGIVEGDVAKRWVFWYWKNGQPNPPLVDHDPLTGDAVHFGYSIAELREIAKKPSEFERPDLLHDPDA